jgi:NADP-dependent 3-hydroxy acid dehydrogenase YdfG
MSTSLDAEKAAGPRTRTLSGQCAVVTGAGRGIGRAIASALAEAGAHVVAVARTRTEIEELASNLRAHGFAATAVPADVGNPTDVAAVAARALQIGGRIDILVNNAGIGIFKPLVDLSIEEFDAMWNVNMRGVFLATKAVLPAMIAAERGAIVNIASLAGKNTFKGGTGYGATKWALRGFAGSLMLEVRDKNIRVVTICPGSVDTGFSAGGKRGATITQPEDVAAAVLFAVTAPERTMFSEIDVRPTRP